ncbi:hypothetical protein SCHPADRAFT_947913 [Schizopora paradoxa]|uniref:Uncharacterized protein n=1 Tax=Schizopora paradoxa TaxID=27342 RepID=A0A0H2QYW6_9AGAM|nr:hypothetical protein SCHPADRAFT_947913 [Schizopora paradoxa]
MDKNIRDQQHFHKPTYFFPKWKNSIGETPGIPLKLPRNAYKFIFNLVRYGSTIVAGTGVIPVTFPRIQANPQITLRRRISLEALRYPLIICVTNLLMITQELLLPLLLSIPLAEVLLAIHHSRHPEVPLANHHSRLRCLNILKVSTSIMDTLEDRVVLVDLVDPTAPTTPTEILCTSRETSTQSGLNNSP